MHLKLVLSLTLAGLAVLFVVQNVTVVQVRFLFWSLSMTLSLFIFLLFATGLIVGWLLHGYWSYRRKSSGVTTTMNEPGRALGPGGR
jgi:uncharacterized integral membrane protein